jgi:hypothetical protein
MASYPKLLLCVAVAVYVVYTAAWLLRSSVAAADLKEFALGDVRAVAKCYELGFVECVPVPEYRQAAVDAVARSGKLIGDAMLRAVDEFCRVHQCT